MEKEEYVDGACREDHPRLKGDLGKRGQKVALEPEW